jgi:hypothetical protein
MMAQALITVKRYLRKTIIIGIPLPGHHRRFLIPVGKKFSGRETLRETIIGDSFSRGHRDAIFP